MRAVTRVTIEFRPIFQQHRNPGRRLLESEWRRIDRRSPADRADTALGNEGGKKGSIVARRV